MPSSRRRATLALSLPSPGAPRHGRDEEGRTLDRDHSPPVAGEVDAFRAIIEGAPAMLWLGDETGHCVFLNRAQREFWGVENGDLSGFDWGSTVHPDDRPLLAAPYEEAMRTQSGFEVEARFRRADGAYRILRTTARPRFSESGAFLGMVGVNTDVTEQRDAEAAQRRASEKLEFALDAAEGIGVWAWEIPQDRLVVDHRFAQAFGLTPDIATHGAPIRFFLNAIHEDDRPRVEAEIDAALRTGERLRSEYRVTSQGAGPRWALAMARCEMDGAGRPLRLAGVALDISERKTREEKMALLTRELSHRIKNVFTVVQAITSMAGREDPDAGPALVKLADRIGALSAAYTHVTAGDDGDGAAPGSLRQLMEALFAPYNCGDERRVRCDGPDVSLSQNAASSLALILHELATNAAKYGALSGDGRVHLTIELPADGQIVLEWSETGGPEVEGEPSTQGFGSRLIRMSAAGLNAEVTAQWRREGLLWRLTARLDRIAGE